MKLVVTSPPDPILTPAEIPGSHPADDAGVAAWIEAATQEIDGPEGWLGRCIGPQQLALQLSGFPAAGCGVYLPCPPLIEVIAVTYKDPAGIDTGLDLSDVVILREQGLLMPGPNGWPATVCSPSAVQIDYEAGYNGDDVLSGGTGVVPARVKQAVMLLVQHYRSVGVENLYLRSKTIEGVGERQFVVSEVPGKVVRDAVTRMLMTLKVF